MTEEQDLQHHEWVRRAKSQLEEGIARARLGDRAGARVILRRIIHANPYEEDAWLWLAWVAETKEQSLRYLQEAQTLLPESPRLAEALRWAKEQLGQEQEPLEPEEPGPAKVVTEQPPRPSLAVNAEELAQKASQTASQALEQLKTRLPPVSLPHFQAERWRNIGMILLMGVALVAVVSLVMLGIANARGRVSTVQALTLPTPVPETAPTPSIPQRIKPYWTQVEVAWNRQDWAAAIRALEQIRALDPRNEEARKRLAEARYGQGVKLIQQNRLEEAQAELDLAIRLDASLQELQEIRNQLKMYLVGLEAYRVQDWRRAVENLQKVYDARPDFRDTQMMLGEAYFHVGQEREKAQVWDEAEAAYQAALRLRPELEEAKARLKVVQEIITPPKRIEVSLSKRLVTVYEDNKPKWIFTCCVGRPSAPTVPGRYQILDKLPMAYASKWDLNMPWWLGIYWAGGSENGFHALPILSNGQILWRGYLGQGCSYGCIVLDTADAKTLYDWAEIGMVVLVNP